MVTRIRVELLLTEMECGSRLPRSFENGDLNDSRESMGVEINRRVGVHDLDRGYDLKGTVFFHLVCATLCLVVGWIGEREISVLAISFFGNV